MRAVRSRGLEQALITAAAFFILFAGLLHLQTAPAHWAHAPAHGLFLALAGLVEVGMGVAFLRRPSSALYRTGVILSGGLITLYVITRVLPAPFGHGPEELDSLGLASKLLEGLGMAVLAALSVSGSVGRRRETSGWYGLGALLAAAFASGWLAYGAGATADWALDAAGVAPAHERVATSAEDAPAASMTINVDVTDAGIQPSSIFIPVGKRVQLVMRNRGSTEHHYVVLGLVPRDLLWLTKEATVEEAALVTDGVVRKDDHSAHHQAGSLVPFRSRSSAGIRPLGDEVHAYAAGGGGGMDVVLFTPTNTGTFAVQCPLHPELAGKVTVF